MTYAYYCQANKCLIEIQNVSYYPFIHSTIKCETRAIRFVFCVKRARAQIPHVQPNSRRSPQLALAVANGCGGDLAHVSSHVLHF